MEITISDDLLSGIELTKRQAIVDFAIGLFSERKVSIGKAAKIAEMSQPEFLKELGQRQIPIHYDIEDFVDDLQTIEDV